MIPGKLVSATPANTWKHKNIEMFAKNLHEVKTLFNHDRFFLSTQIISVHNCRFQLFSGLRHFKNSSFEGDLANGIGLKRIFEKHVP